MEVNIFINQAFNSAINMYMNNKGNTSSPIFNSFPVMVIRTLIFIYGELDIINPYRTNNVNRMGGFDSNLKKFGFNEKKLEDFKDCFQKYAQNYIAGKKPNPYFFKIEKYLIDMYFCRKKALNSQESEQKEFEKYIYISTNENPYIKQEIKNNAYNIQELDLYFQSKIFESNHEFQFMPYKQNTLIPEAYTILGYNLDTIAQMDEKTLSQLNDQILAFFKIDTNDEEKNQRLKEAIIYFQRYRTSFTSGNGYVDMLLLLGLISTIMMTLFAITVKILG